MIEFGRKLYQANMNNIFACAISADRSDQLRKMQELIDAKSPSSEIKSKLQKMLFKQFLFTQIPKVM